MKLQVSNSNEPNWRCITVSAEIPKELKPLEEMSKNLWWVWNQEGKRLFHDLDRDLWRRVGENPVMLLQQMSYERCQEIIADEMFSDTSCHNENHTWQSVFSLSVHPDWQGMGYGRDLLNALIAQARREGRKGVTLTCLERKLGYYESFGFVNRGVSKSVHGGAVWYDMTLTF